MRKTNHITFGKQIVKHSQKGVRSVRCVCVSTGNWRRCSHVSSDEKIMYTIQYAGNYGKTFSHMTMDQIIAVMQFHRLKIALHHLLEFTDVFTLSQTTHLSERCSRHLGYKRRQTSEIAWMLYHRTEYHMESTACACVVNGDGRN